MTDAAEQRIAVLESELRALKMLLGAQQRTLTQPRRRDEPSVKVTYPVSRVEVPSAKEFSRLSEIVLARYPQLASRADREGFDVQFRVAFQRLLHVGRSDRLDVAHGLDFWTDDCRAFQQQHQIALSVFVGGAALTAAVVACGDILYAPLDRFPFDLGFGLVAYGGGRPSTGKWREVLITGHLPEPTPLDRPAVARSPATGNSSH